MNAFGFFFRQLSSKFGFRSERQYWGAINRETQILSEAEGLLGRLAWPDVENIDDLSGEYWQIRDLDRQQQLLREETKTADEKNNALKEELYRLEDECEEQLQALRDRKSKRMEEALVLMRHIDQIKTWKEDTKKKFQNLKVKIDLMKRHGETDSKISSEVEKNQAAMNKLKEEFSGDITEINNKTAEIEAIEKEVAELDRSITELKTGLKAQTASLNIEVGRYSKQIAELSAKIGALENTKSDFYFQVGHYLSSRIDSNDPEIRATLRRHRPLISRILYYRKSIAYNRHLVRSGKKR